MWLKPSAEQQFLYGHNVTKAGLGRISESVEKYSGVVIYSMNDLPLVSPFSNQILLPFLNVMNILQGFGAAAKSTADCRHVDPATLVCFHQGDIGSYIRSENTLT
jgi:60S ribosome subunit biogenesis protein NIP7